MTEPEPSMEVRQLMLALAFETQALRVARERAEELECQLAEERERSAVLQKALAEADDRTRRVAKVLAGPAKRLKVLGHDLTADELKAIDAALAYPEGK